MKPYKRPEKDLENPPGQIVNPIPNFEKPLEKAIEEYKQVECCHKTVLVRCAGCPYG
jgi:hypothetical protein